MPMTINYSESYNGSAANTSSITINSLTFGDWTNGIGGGGTIYNGAAIYGNILVNGNVAANVDAIPRFRGPTTVNVSGSAVAVPHNANGSGAFSFSFSGFYMSISDFSSGNKWYPTESSKTVSLTTHTRTFTLSISAGSASSITVTRGGATLYNGSSITYGDALTVSCAAATGYYLTSNPSGTYTVTGNLSLSSAADVLRYTLSVANGAHTAVSVDRTSSPYKGAATGYVGNGAYIYYGDALKVTAAVDEGYELTQNPAGTQTVTGNVTVTSAAALITYLLSTALGDHTTVSITRTASPIGGAAAGEVYGGDTLYLNDVLNVVYAPEEGYGIKQATAGGADILSGASVTVSGNVAVVIMADVMAAVHIVKDGAFASYLIYIGHNGESAMYQPYIVRDGAWQLYA